MYATMIADNNVVQNSWNYGSLVQPAFQPDEPGIYTITLQALTDDATAVVASVSINVVILTDSVTPTVIFGDGNANGGFTTTQSNGVELGIRGKWRFDNPNDSNMDRYGFDSDGVYHFAAGNPTNGGYSWANNSIATPKWSFDWSINSDFDGNGGMLGEYTYVLSLDVDPSADTDITYDSDPINVNWADHAIGDNTAGPGPNGGRVNAANATMYNTLLSTKNLAQNSWNYQFFNSFFTDDLLSPFDARIPGRFTISLKAFKAAVEVAAVSITIITTNN